MKILLTNEEVDKIVAKHIGLIMSPPPLTEWEAKLDYETMGYIVTPKITELHPPCTEDSRNG